MSELQVIQPKLTRKDFASDQDVRWCPGCGDYAILAQVQKVMPELGVPRENIVFISGIGCSSRFPYYMNTYGMHSIHGRAPTVATGLKLANPDLKVFVITGDGDGLSIGGNHLLHAMRRNVDLNIILFNNRIYGLTKGQYSPTSEPGTKTKSSPMGSIETALNPISVAIASEATFVARTVDTWVKHMAETIEAAARHPGISFVEVLQNCPIFNDGTWSMVKDPATREENALLLEHGKPMVFAGGTKGVRLNRFNAEIVDVGDGGYSTDDLLVHDEKAPSSGLAFMLSRFHSPDYPIPLGVFRNISAPTYEDGVMGQIATARKQRGDGDLNKLFTGADTWRVEEHEASLDRMHDGAVAIEHSEAADEYTETYNEPQPDAKGVQAGLMADRMHAMAQPPRTVAHTASLGEVIRIMQRDNTSCIMIVDGDGKLTGVFTGRDALMRVATQITDLDAVPIADVMTHNPRCLPADAPVAYAVNMMANYGFRHVPVVDRDNKPVGMVLFRDVVKYLRTHFD